MANALFDLISFNIEDVDLKKWDDVLALDTELRETVEKYYTIRLDQLRIREKMYALRLKNSRLANTPSLENLKKMGENREQLKQLIPESDGFKRLPLTR